MLLNCIELKKINSANLPIAYISRVHTEDVKMVGFWSDFKTFTQNYHDLDSRHISLKTSEAAKPYMT